MFGTFLTARGQGSDEEGDRNALARKWITELREGVLLVRLQTRSKSLERIRERGLEEKAEEIEAELKAENEAVVEAFREEYRFSPVYFFESQYSKLLKDRDFDQVEFFDVNRKPVAPDLSKKPFFIAEFSRVEADTAHYETTPDPGFGALVIKSDQFVQLDRPFPFYVRTYETLPILRRKPKKVVRKMNEKLFGFY